MLIENWRAVLTRAWSARLMILAGLLSGAEVALPYCTDVVQPGALAMLSAFASSGAFVMRFLAQKNMRSNDGNK